MLRILAELVIDVAVLMWINSVIPGGMTGAIVVPIIVFGCVQYVEGTLRKK